MELKKLFSIRWNPIKTAKWGKKMSKGVVHYVLVHGSLFGLFMLFWMSVYEYISDYGFTLANLGEFINNNLIFHAIWWLICGYIWGIITWRVTSNSYFKHIEEKSDSE